MEISLKSNGEQKTVFVLWSGGLDSTYLIWWLLENNYKVVAANTNIKNNKDTMRYESQAIKKILKVFNKYKNFKYNGVVVNIEVKKFLNKTLYFHQIPVFLLSAIYSIPENIDYLALGYVMNDDAISYLDEIKDIWSAYKKICNEDFKTELWFPIAKLKKQEMIDRLPNNLKTNIVWCEAPKFKRGKYKSCGECPSCKRHSIIKKNI